MFASLGGCVGSYIYTPGWVGETCAVGGRVEWILDFECWRNLYLETRKVDENTSKLGM